MNNPLAKILNGEGMTVANKATKTIEELKREGLPEGFLRKVMETPKETTVKQASIFDAPRPTLNQAVFAGDVMRPDVIAYLQQLLSVIFPLGKVYRLILMGSTTTFQYNETSDIDVNVQAVKGEAFDAWHQIFKKFNNTPNLLPGTAHPINFFFQEYVSPLKSSDDWSNSLGAYDILKNSWIKRPVPFERIGDPSDTYADVIQYVQMMVGMIEGEVKAIQQAIHIGDRDKALNALKILQRFFRQIEEQRKDSYKYSAGVKSYQQANLIYKLIEHGPYGKLLKDLIGD